MPRIARISLARLAERLFGDRGDRKNALTNVFSYVHYHYDTECVLV